MSDAKSFSAIPTRILVPIDFSPSSHAALDTAAELAERFGAQVFLMTAILEFPDRSVPDAMTEANVIERARELAGERFAVSEAALGARGIRVTSSVEIGNDEAEIILAAIEREKADLVVITAHGLSGRHSQAFGSVAEKLVKLVQCPLLLLRRPRLEPGAGDASEAPVKWW
jgi:nucleotide-binding universal stress UspA family protein